MRMVCRHGEQTRQVFRRIHYTWRKEVILGFRWQLYRWIVYPPISPDLLDPLPKLALSSYWGNGESPCSGKENADGPMRSVRK
jgi:hypothetical protein